MRSLLAPAVAILALAPLPSQAQNSSAPASAAPARTPVKYSALVPPPGATVTLEINAGKNDLLSGVPGSTPPGAPSRGNRLLFGLLTSKQLETAFKDVTYLQLFQYSKEGVAAQSSNALVNERNADALGYYEKQLLASGGRRLLYSAQGTRVVIIGFDKPGGMAFITEDRSRVLVGRLDGKINTKPLASILLALTGS